MQRDKDPGDLAGDLRRRLRGAGKEGEREALTRGPGMAAGEVSACVRRALRAEGGWQVGLGRDAVGAAQEREKETGHARGAARAAERGERELGLARVGPRGGRGGGGLG